MKKVLALLLGCFMALVATAVMADTRTDSLGLSAGKQIDDLDSIWLFPQDAANFGNVVDYRLGFLGSPNDDWGGIIHKDWDDVGYIGIYTARPFNNDHGPTPNVNAADQNGILNGNSNWANALNPAASSWWGGNYVGQAGNFVQGHYAYWPYGETVGLDYFGYVAGGDVKVADPQNKADIFWAKDFSDVTLGVHLNYANQTGQDENNNNGYGSGTGTFTNTNANGNTYTGANENQDSSVIGADLGLTLKSLGPDASLALGVGYSLGSVNYKQVDTETDAAGTATNTRFTDAIKDNNISELRVNALLKSKINDTTTGRVYLTGHLDNLGLTQNGAFDRTNTGVTDTNAGDFGPKAAPIPTRTWTLVSPATTKSPTARLMSSPVWVSPTTAASGPSPLCITPPEARL